MTFVCLCLLHDTLAILMTTLTENYKRTHKHAKCRLVYTLNVIFDAFFNMLIYVTAHYMY